MLAFNDFDWLLSGSRRLWLLWLAGIVTWHMTLYCKFLEVICCARWTACRVDFILLLSVLNAIEIILISWTLFYCRRIPCVEAFVISVDVSSLWLDYWWCAWPRFWCYLGCLLCFLRVDSSWRALCHPWIMDGSVRFSLRTSARMALVKFKWYILFVYVFFFIRIWVSFCTIFCGKQRIVPVVNS